MWNKLYKRRLFDSVRFKEGITIEDCLANYYIYIQQVTLVSSSAVNYHYLQRGDSITGTTFSEKSFDILKVHGEIMNSSAIRCELPLGSLSLIRRNSLNVIIILLII